MPVIVPGFRLGAEQEHGEELRPQNKADAHEEG
jgi:hypothetical protein